jgi:hypothetical protein
MNNDDLRNCFNDLVLIKNNNSEFIFSDDYVVWLENKLIESENKRKERFEISDLEIKKLTLKYLHKKDNDKFDIKNLVSDMKKLI